jgi:hypothetical protein
MQLISNKNEAYKLLDMLVEYNLVGEFNKQFPKILREIKTNFKNIGANKAFSEIDRIVSKTDVPLNAGDFRAILEGMYNDLIREQQKSRRGNNRTSKIIDITDIDDEINQVEALLLTYNSVDRNGQLQLEQTISLDGDQDSILEDVGSFLSSGGLDTIYNNFKNEDDDIIQKINNQPIADDDQLIQEVTVKDIDEYFNNNDTDRLEQIVDALGYKDIKALKSMRTKRGTEYIWRKFLGKDLNEANPDDVANNNITADDVVNIFVRGADGKFVNNNAIANIARDMRITSNRLKQIYDNDGPQAVANRMNAL